MTHRRHPWITGAITALVLAFLLAPILLVVLFSFHSARSLTLPFEGFSTRWYRQVLEDDEIRDALVNSLQLAGTVALASLMLGTAAAYGISRSQSRLRSLINAFLVSPIAVPGLFVGAALSLFIGRIGVAPSLTAVWLGHLCLALPFFVIIAVGAFDRTDRALDEVSADLGASPWRTFRRALLPQTWPILGGGVALTFMLSFDEFFVTNFVVGSEQTVPVLVLQRMRRTIDPTINVISTLLILVTALLVVTVAAGLHQARRRSQA